MGKDGCWGVETSGGCSGKNMYDVHIAAVQAMDRELERLHVTLSKMNNGDDDVTQEQITTLVNELCRLSEALSDEECL